MRHFIRGLVYLAALLVLAACGGSDAPPAATATTVSRADPTPLPLAEGWVTAHSPITLDSVARMGSLGRLDAPEPPSTVFAYALSLDNSLLAGLNNQFVLVWDLVSGQRLFSNDRQGANTVLFGPDRNEIYTVGNDGGIRIYNAADGALTESLGAIDQYNGISAYDPAGGWLALASDIGAIQIWDMPARTTINVLEGPEVPLTAMAFSPDGKTLAAVDQNGTVALWDFQAGTKHGGIDLLSPVTAVVYAPSGSALVVDSSDGVLVLDAVTAAVVARLTRVKNDGLFAFMGQTDTLMLGGKTTDITLWDTFAGTLAATLPNTIGDRVSATSSPQGDMLLASSRTATSLWNISQLASGTVLRGNAALPETDVIRVVWTSDGLQVLVFNALGPIYVHGIP